MNSLKKVLANTGMGGFLNPPTHPEYTQSVMEKYRNGREAGRMSLSGAAAEGFEPAKQLLASWQAPPIESEPVQAWIAKVLGYFRGGYRNPNVPESLQWNADKLVFDLRDPMEHADDHAGVHLIRKYYPDFVVTAEHFRTAKWG